MADQSFDFGSICNSLNSRRFDVDIGPDYQAKFNQLNTTDESLTIEALRGIAELVKKDSKENARSILTYWCNVYYMLSTDSDPNVRKAAQACHGELVRASGGLTEDLLKLLLHNWLVMCCDSHAPTAALARVQLQDMFPDRKLGEALMSCKKEILKKLECNLTGALDVELRLPTMKTTNLRFMFRDQTKTVIYEKVKQLAFSSLKAVEFLVSIIPAEDLDWWWSQLANLLRSCRICDICVVKPKFIRSYFNEVNCRYYFYPQYEWSTGIQKQPHEMVLCIQDIFGTFTENTSCEIYALRADCIKGRLVCPLENDNSIMSKVVHESNETPSELDKRDLVLFLHNLIFRAGVLKDFLFKISLLDESYANTVRMHERVMEMLNKIWHDAAVLDVLKKTYSFWPDYKIIENGKKLIDELLKHILSMLGRPNIIRMLSVFFAANATSRGYYWSYASQKFDTENNGKYKNFVSYNIPVDGPYFRQLYKSSEILFKKIGYFHIFQAHYNKSHNRCRFLMTYSTLVAHFYRPVLCNELISGLCEGLRPADVIIKVFRKHNELMLFNTDLSAARWSVVVSNAAIVEFLNEEVTNRGTTLPSHQWDFTFETLYSLISSLQLSVHRWSCCKVAILARPVLKLLVSIYNFVAKPHVGGNLFSRALSLGNKLGTTLFEFAMFALDCEDEKMTSSHISTINELIEGIESLQKFSRIPPCMLQPICNSIGTTMRRSSHHANKYLAFALLDFVAYLLCGEDASIRKTWRREREETPRPEFFLEYFTHILKDLHGMLMTSLRDIESHVEPGSEAHSTALSFLLVSMYVIKTCKHLTSHRFLANMLQLYTDLIRESDFTSIVMESSVRILLDEELHDLTPYEFAEDIPNTLANLKLQLNLYWPCDANMVGSMACVVLRDILHFCVTANEARKWVLTMKPPMRFKVIDKISKFVCPMLRGLSLRELWEHQEELSVTLLTVQFQPTVAICKIRLDEDSHLDMTLKLPSKYPFELPLFLTPLSPVPDRECIKSFFIDKNGSLKETLRMWINAVSATVQSASECSICCGRVHETTGRLPTEACSQCKNLFHCFCIAKWFATTHRENCPLCRSNFRR